MTGKRRRPLLCIAIGAVSMLIAQPALVLPAFVLPAFAQPTPADPASAQPSLPKPLDSGIPPTSPIIGGGRSPGEAAAPPPARRPAPRQAVRRPAHQAGRRHRPNRYAEPLERPALAGVELVAPIPVPVQPPHFTVPTPAYPLENFATFYTTPLPPVVCHRVPRDPYAPDPQLNRETTVLCEADNP